MQTEYGVSATTVVAAAPRAEAAGKNDVEAGGVRRRWRTGTAPIAFGDIVLGVCAVVGTVVVVLDAWSSYT
jgi:hypothetical protein